MRIALLTPTYWPEVRRGSERVVHDLGAALARRGHDVTVLTTHRGLPRRSVEDGIRVVRLPRLPQPPGFSAHEYHLANVPGVYLHLRGGKFDLAHSVFPSESWAAVHARAAGGPPVVASLHGIPTRRYLVARRYRLEMLLAIARRAEECTVLSEAAARPFRSFLLRDPVVLPGGVNGASFAPEAPRSPAPTLFCASSLGDPRKRPELLFAAFARLRRDRPDARLLVARPRDPFMSGGAPELPDGAEWVDVSDPAQLARAYASAWVTVNPAPSEAFGLVLIESLAAGTPVVADTSGAAPEIVGNRPVGRLFEPGDERSLTSAIEAAVDYAGRPEAVAECRARARDFDWDTLVERYEEVYERALARGPRSA